MCNKLQDEVKLKILEFIAFFISQNVILIDISSAWFL